MGDVVKRQISWSGCDTSSVLFVSQSHTKAKDSLGEFYDVEDKTTVIIDYSIGKRKRIRLGLRRIKGTAEPPLVMPLS